MKSAQFTNILMGLTACSAVASIVLYSVLVSRAREIGQLQPQAAAIQQSRIAATGLVRELVEYSTHNPQIQPILQSMATPAAPAQPAAN